MKRRAKPTEAPLTIDGAHPTMTALEWKSGMATYPTSSGVRSNIIEKRVPVTISRRWLQMTALGASDVPDVKISAQGVSMSGSNPGSSSPTAIRASSSDEPTTSTSHGRRSAMGSRSAS